MVRLPWPSNKEIPRVPVRTLFHSPKHGMEPEIIDPLESIASTPSLIIRHNNILSQRHRTLFPFSCVDMLLEIAINPFEDIFNRHSVLFSYQNWPSKLNIIGNSANSEFRGHRPRCGLRAIWWKQRHGDEAVPVCCGSRLLSQVPEERRNANDFASQVRVELALPWSVRFWLVEPSSWAWGERRVFKSCYPSFRVT